MNEESLEQLLDRYFDGGLRPHEKAELEAALLDSPHARETFWKRARFHALLHRRGRENLGRLLAKPPVATFPSPIRWKPKERPRGFVRPLAKFALSAAAILLLFVGISRVREAAEHRFSISAPDPVQGIVTIRRAVDVVWADTPRQTGDVLGPGTLNIQHGCVEIEFHRGARVVIEGPAELELITDMQVRCNQGKLYAEVPPRAVGFEILSPDVTVVDRGTEFGMEVTRAGTTEVHVFSGKVDYAVPLAPEGSMKLLEGKAILVHRSGESKTIPIRPASFTTAPPGGNSAAWEKSTALLRSDPTLVVQYTFDAASLASRTLRNHAPMAKPESHGTIVGCTPTEGRWPGKLALDFKLADDRVRFALNRQHERMTCVMWVKPEMTGKPFTALLMSSAAAPGEMQWQFDQNGRLVAGKRILAGWGDSNVEQIDTGKLLTPQRVGTWMQLAFVYDGSAGTFTHYLDGKKVEAGTISTNPPLVTARLEIGNWTPLDGSPPDAERGFVGSIDELLIFSRALHDDEIRNLWNIGREL